MIHQRLETISILQTLRDLDQFSQVTRPNGKYDKHFGANRPSCLSTTYDFRTTRKRSRFIEFDPICEL